MKLHVKDTQPVNASGETLWEVITDYPSYPRFNPTVASMTVLRKDEDGAEFLADMSSKMGKQAHAFDRYRRDGDIAIMRTYDRLGGLVDMDASLRRCRPLVELVEDPTQHRLS